MEELSLLMQLGLAMLTYKWLDPKPVKQQLLITQAGMLFITVPA